MSFVYPGSAWPTRSWPSRYWPEAGTTPPEPEPTLLPDVGWVHGLYALILVGDRQGVVMGEMAEAEIESVTWTLNEAGEARLNVPNPGTAERLIALGNRLLIYLDNGLPPWAGYMDPPRGRRWGSISLTGYGGERLLEHRVTARTRAFAAATAGSIFLALLAEQARPVVMEAGNVDISGATIAAEYHYQSLLEAVNGLLETAGGDWNVSGALENGRIRLRANYYRQRGRYLANVYLLEGHNIGESDVEEQGPIVYEWLTAGAGNGWEPWSRAFAAARDDVSAERHGLRQAGEVVSGITSRAALEAYTARNLAVTAEPYVAVTLDAVNLPPARFGDYEVGDWINLALYSVPFQGVRRVIGREFDPRAGACRLVVV